MYGVKMWRALGLGERRNLSFQKLRVTFDGKAIYIACFLVFYVFIGF